MKDFDKRMKRHQDRFDRDWDNARRFAMAWGLFLILMGLVVIGFLGWVIIKLLMFWGVV